MENLSSVEIAALLRYHINDNFGINASRIAELAELYKRADIREHQANKKAAA